MNTWIVLLRGINVGGKNVLPMKQLRDTLTNAGLQGVETYIQSGNVVFRSKKRSANSLAKAICDAITEEHGIETRAFVLNRSQLLESIAANPFPAAESEPKSLHINFLEREPNAANVSKLKSLAVPSEDIRVIQNRVYVHAPDGIGRSKLAANLETCLGVSGTGRNWRTIQKLDEMTASADQS